MNALSEPSALNGGFLDKLANAINRILDYTGYSLHALSVVGPRSMTLWYTDEVWGEK